MSGRGISSSGALALLLVALVSVSAWRIALQNAGIDFYQFWLVGQTLADEEFAEAFADPYRPAAGSRLAQIGREQALAHGGERLHAAVRARPVVEVFSSPFLYAVFGAAASGDYERDYRRFQLASLLAALAAVALLCRTLDYGGVATGLAIALLGVPFEPYYSDTVVGNVNRLLLLAMALFLALGAAPGTRWRAGLGGAVLGAALVFKPTLAFAMVFLALARLLERRFRRFGWEAGGALLGAASAVLFGAWWSGSFALWKNWIGGFDRLLWNFSLPAEAGNFSLAQLALEVTGRDLSVLLAATFGLALLAALLQRVRAGPARGQVAARAARLAVDDALVLGAGVTATLLFGRLAWQHYYLLTAPLLLCLMRPRPGAAARGHGGLSIAGAAAWFLLSFQAFRLFDSSSAWLAGATVCGGALLLLGIAIAELVRAPGGMPEELPSRRPSAASEGSASPASEPAG